MHLVNRDSQSNNGLYQLDKLQPSVTQPFYYRLSLGGKRAARILVRNVNLQNSIQFGNERSNLEANIVNSVTWLNTRIEFNIKVDSCRTIKRRVGFEKP